MELLREIGFTVDGIEGRLKVVTGPFWCRVYQDGRLLEGEKHLYKVRTADGGSNGLLKVVRWFDNTVVVVFRGTKTKLDAGLSFREYAVGGLPLLIIPAAVFCAYGGMFGDFFRHVAGAYVVGALSAFAAVYASVCNYTFMRIRKEPVRQLVFCACTFPAAAAGTAALLGALGWLA